MNKRSVLFAAILAVVLCFVPSVNVWAAEDSYKVVIDDQADLLTGAEEQALYQKMRPVAEYTNVVFHTVASHDFSSTRSYAENYYVRTIGGGVTGTIFIIDMDKRQIYIVSDGAAYRSITANRADTITDNIYTYATRGEYYACAAEAFSEILTILEGGRIAAPMKYVSNALLALAAAMLVMFLIVQSVASPKRASARELRESSDVRFSAGDPIVTHTGQTRRYDPPAKSSGGGGGGGGHGGGGGGFSGGGGGHGF